MTVIILTNICTGIIFFVLGRYFLFLKPGATATRIVPTRTIRMQDFKGDTIYRSMASRLKREGFINVQAAGEKEANVIKRKVADLANLSTNALAIEESTPGFFTITKIEDNG